MDRTDPRVPKNVDDSATAKIALHTISAPYQIYIFIVIIIGHIQMKMSHIYATYVALE